MENLGNTVNMRLNVDTAKRLHAAIVLMNSLVLYLDIYHHEVP